MKWNIFFIFFPLLIAGAFGYGLVNDIQNSFDEQNRIISARIGPNTRTVQRQERKHIIWENAMNGLSLYSGDKVRTGTDSATRITFVSGDIIDVGPNSMIEINADRNKGTSHITVTQGELYIIKDSGNTTFMPARGTNEELVKVLNAQSPEDKTPLAVLQDAVEKEAEENAPEKREKTEEKLVSYRAPPPPPLPLSAPRALYPTSQSIVGRTELEARRALRFSWEQVPNAVSYNWTLRNSRGQILERRNTRDTSVNLTNIRLFIGQSSMTWTVQAVSSADARDSAITRTSFEIYLPALKSPNTEDAIKL
ncbi:MAG: FecR family protein [Spirochaetaceae bacterium]|jgi:hypothetical protein|nr:FecR family protein [Spirochaetaceae bacterium]